MKKYIIITLAVLVCIPAYAALTSRFLTNLRSDYTSTSTISTPRDNLDYTIRKDWSSGTGSNSASIVYRSSRTLASGASESLDLVGGVTDVFGTSLSFSRVKAFCIENTATTTLTFGAPDAASGWSGWCGDVSDSVTIQSKGVFSIVSPTMGLPIAAGSDTIKITNATGATGTYYIWVIGTP